MGCTNFPLGSTRIDPILELRAVLETGQHGPEYHWGLRLGLLVPVRDAEALAAAMEWFIEQPGLIEQMGQRGRERAEAVYDVRKVNEVILGELGL